MKKTIGIMTLALATTMVTYAQKLLKKRSMPTHLSGQNVPTKATVEQQL